MASDSCTFCLTIGPPIACNLCIAVSYDPREVSVRPSSLWQGTDSANCGTQMECQSTPLRWFHFLLYYLSRHLTFQHVYFTLYRWKPSTRGQALNTSASDVHAAVNYLDVNSSISISTNAQWKSTVSKMTHVWTVVVLGSTLFLPSVLINQSSRR